MKVGLIFGGMSNEKEVSVKSCNCIFENIDKTKYEVNLIFIDEFGEFYSVDNTNLDNKKSIENVLNYLKTFDVVFPCLHGKYGEDGSIQGLLDFAKVKYVGAKVLCSSVCMDKVFTKYIFEKAGLNQAKYQWIKYHENKITYVDKNLEEKEIDFDNLELILNNTLGYPIYVKPSNSGSSVGMSKVSSKDELLKAIKVASLTDKKIIFEEEINGQELECAVLDGEILKLGLVGEVLTDNNFYDYDKKYNNEIDNTLIPANINDYIKEKVEKLTIKAFKAVDGSAIARVDFFLKDDKIYINEINTMPGFTNISMYPKLLESVNISIPEIIDILIKKAS